MNTIRLPDGREIKYELTRKRVKNINMRINAEGVVHVSASTAVSIKRIEEILTERADYLLNAVNRLRQREQRSDITAEKMSWLGREYPVRIIRNSREQVALEENEIRLYTTHPENAQAMLTEWTSDRFSEVITELNREVRAKLEQRGLKSPPTKITIKDMKTRWGSCSYTRGHISMNFRLAAYPVETVLGVLWHEYSHYWHHNHYAAFYDFLLSFYPDYHKWNSLLK